MKLIKAWATALLMTSTVLSTEPVDNPEPPQFPRHLMVHYVMTRKESDELQHAWMGRKYGLQKSIGIAQGLLNSKDQEIHNLYI